MKHHLAQVNIGRLTAPLDSPEIAGFVALLDEVNALAESSKGFVWRLKDEAGNATDIKAFDDERIIVNMSVWESVEDLKNFVYRSSHTPVLRRRGEWFEKYPSAYLALWWIPEGHVPTLSEAKQKLANIDALGDTPQAFTFRNIFEPTENSIFQKPETSCLDNMFYSDSATNKAASSNRFTI
jgi:Domain of unknown function (DUF3291)